MLSDEEKSDLVHFHAETLIRAKFKCAIGDIVKIKKFTDEDLDEFPDLENYIGCVGQLKSFVELPNWMPVMDIGLYDWSPETPIAGAIDQKLTAYNPGVVCVDLKSFDWYPNNQKAVEFNAHDHGPFGIGSVDVSAFEMHYNDTIEVMISKVEPDKIAPSLQNLEKSTNSFIL